MYLFHIGTFTQERGLGRIDAFEEFEGIGKMSTNDIDSNSKEVAQECPASSCGGITEVSELADDNLCASCGIAALDNVKLKKCTCELVKYCSDECRDNHREQHEEECKKRMAELNEQLLFTQPESSYHGDCPICFLPLSLDLSKSTMKSCCSKLICKGCDHAHHISNKQKICPFCREPVPKNDEEIDKRRMKRVEANDPVELSQMGAERYEEGDYDTAFEYFTKAAELGDLKAHHNLGYMHDRGEGVEKDEEKAVYHYEKAAIGGDPSARFNLGNHEARNGRVDKAVKHYIIAAKLGHTGAMETLWDHYKHGSITKEDLDATLRTHQAAIDATKSPQREAAAAAKRERV